VTGFLEKQVHMIACTKEPKCGGRSARCAGVGRENISVLRDLRIPGRVMYLGHDVVPHNNLYAVGIGSRGFGACVRGIEDELIVSSWPIVAVYAEHASSGEGYFHSGWGRAADPIAMGV